MIALETFEILFGPFFSHCIIYEENFVAESFLKLPLTSSRGHVVRKSYLTIQGGIYGM